MERRDWLRSAALSGGFALMGGLNPALALTKEEIRKYHPRPFEGPIRLSSNENPYGPSEKVRKAITDSFNEACRYPYAYMDELAVILAEKEGVTPDHIIITGGSTEGLKITGITYAANGGEIIAGQPTFLAMMSYAKQWGGNVKWVPVKEDMSYDLKGVYEAINPKTKLVFLCNPNNPTSTVLPKGDLMKYAEAISDETMLFSDEAYYDYIELPDYPSMVELVKKDKNVIVSRTFSKVYGMAGLRIGYLIAKPEIAEKIRKNVVAFTNVPAVQAAKAALEDNEFYEFSLQKNREAKKMICDTLDSLELPYVPSHTNFIFFKSGQHISKLHQAMLDKGVRVGRPFPPFFEWCRISTGTLEEVALFNNAMMEVYS
ncbi:pyridoxal phosphate-dependent aminotransferase [Robertkochia aurantiaca]|uniref:pyridoxal phosphate-dependent aminotransferase n=1 Tax=Robertkochia aurantiaca TaxID=2873700 RepID=UPI001CCBAF6F|nr:histidinol-phosphate transaminase [Robertkochia sp. 3YJGBD-33]